MSTRRRIRAAVIGAVAAAVALPTVATGAPATPGAPGIGDPYFPEYGNGGYDATTYDINVDVDPKTELLNGNTTVVARATQDLTTFNLDLLLPATSVTVNGQPATITQSGRELTVRPKKWLRAGASFTAVVKYAGNPFTTKVDGFTPWRHSSTGAFVLQEPTSAPWWYPSNDHPRDKAKHTVTATVPAGLQVISNGLPVGEATTSAGKSTSKWAEDDPRATYLSVLAMGKYDVTTGNSPLGKPYINAVEQGLPNAAGAKKAMARTGLITNWLQSQFGTYQFNSVGGIVPNGGLGFALETQTRPLYSPTFFGPDGNDDVVVHEMAHQWFGDSLSPYNWRDVWLNEGFASFAEWIWSEKKGMGDAQDIFDTSYAKRPADSPYWKVPIAEPGAGNIIPSAAYSRGPMALQALRNRMGDPKFFRLLRTWTGSHANGNVQTKDFTDLAEQISGKNLDTFFHNWLYAPTRPEPTPENGFPVNSAARKGVKPNVPKSYEPIERTHQQLHNKTNQQ